MATYKVVDKLLPSGQVRHVDSYYANPETDDFDIVICENCGALVVDVPQHNRFHASVDNIIALRWGVTQS